MSFVRRRVVTGALLIPGLLLPLEAQGQLKVEEVWASKGAPHSPLVSVGDLHQDSEGNIWITDPRVSSLYRFKPATGEYETVASRGDGPGELIGPVHLAGMPEGGVAVHDISRSAIDTFTEDGAFVQRIRSDLRIVNPKDFKILPDGRFVISGGSPGMDGAVHLFSVEGERLASLGKIPDTKNPRAGTMVGGGALALMDDDRLLYSQAAPYRIEIKDLGPQEDHRIHRSDDDLLPAIGDDFIMRDVVEGRLRTRFKWGFPRSQLVAVLRSGAILNVAVWRNDGFSVWDRVDGQSGELLERSRLSKPYEPHSLTSNGHVLAEYRDPVTDETIVTELKVKW